MRNFSFPILIAESVLFKLINRKKREKQNKREREHKTKTKRRTAWTEHKKKETKVSFETIIIADHLCQVGCDLCLSLFVMMIMLRWRPGGRGGEGEGWSHVFRCWFCINAPPLPIYNLPFSLLVRYKNTGEEPWRTRGKRVGRKVGGHYL